MTLVRYQIGCIDDGARASLTIDGHTSVGAWGDSIAAAFNNATKLASAIVNDPLISAVLPPGTKAAIEITRQVATAFHNGTLPDVMPVLEESHPSAFRLARQLLKLPGGEDVVRPRVRRHKRNPDDPRLVNHQLDQER